jgi:tetratricopeptide (TPR) repeat protein
MEPPLGITKLTGAEALFLAGRCVEHRDLETAIHYYARAWAEHEIPAGLLYQLAELSLKRGESAEARKLFIKSIEHREEAARSYLGLGRLHHQEGREEEARCEFELAVLSDPRNAEAFFEAGQSLRRLGRNSEAIERMQSAVQLNQNNRLYAYRLHLYQIDVGQDQSLGLQTDLQLMMRPSAWDWRLIAAALALKKGEQGRAAEHLKYLHDLMHPEDFNEAVRDPFFARHARDQELVAFFSNESSAP